MGLMFLNSHIDFFLHEYSRILCLLLYRWISGGLKFTVKFNTMDCLLGVLFRIGNCYVDKVIPSEDWPYYFSTISSRVQFSSNCSQHWNTLFLWLNPCTLIVWCCETVVSVLLLLMFCSWLSGWSWIPL